MLIITDQLSAILTSLGWDILNIVITNNHTYHRSKTETSIYLRGVKLGDSEDGHRSSVSSSKFVLGCDYKDAVYADKIKPVTIDLDNLHWEKRLLTWHTSTTFKLAELRAKYAERDHVVKKKSARLEEHRGQLYSITRNSQYLHGCGRLDDGSFQSMRFDTQIINEINNALLRQPSAEDAARLGVKLVDYLRIEGFIR
jgi:hypothetical protein